MATSTDCYYPAYEYLRNVIGDTPLHRAAVFGKKGDVQKILATNPEYVNSLNITSTINATPLDCLLTYNKCSKETIEILSMMLKKDADVSITNKKGHTILHLAARLGSYDAIKLILQHGGNKIINVVDNNGYSPLHSLLIWGAENVSQDQLLPCLMLLLKAGADVNQARIQKKKNEHFTGMRGLVKNYDNHPNNLAFTYPLNLALCNSGYEVASILILWGATLDTIDASKLTPLQYAISYNKLNIANLIIALGGGLVGYKNGLLKCPIKKEYQNISPEIIEFVKHFEITLLLLEFFDNDEIELFVHKIRDLLLNLDKVPNIDIRVCEDQSKIDELTQQIVKVTTEFLDKIFTEKSMQIDSLLTDIEFPKFVQTIASKALTDDKTGSEVNKVYEQICENVEKQKLLMKHILKEHIKVRILYNPCLIKKQDNQVKLDSEKAHGKTHDKIHDKVHEKTNPPLLLSSLSGSDQASGFRLSNLAPLKYKNQKN